MHRIVPEYIMSLPVEDDYLATISPNIDHHTRSERRINEVSNVQFGRFFLRHGVTSLI